MYHENIGKRVIITHHAQGGGAGLLAAIALRTLMDSVSYETGAICDKGIVTAEKIEMSFIWTPKLNHEKVDIYLQKTGVNPKVCSVTFQKSPVITGA